MPTIAGNLSEQQKEECPFSKREKVDRSWCRITSAYATVSFTVLLACQEKWVREIITPGTSKSYDGWKTCERMIKQPQDSVLPSFEELHPGCTTVFAHDNSMNHKRMPLDGLNVTRLNLSAGGKNARVSCRDGFFPPNGQKVYRKKNDRGERIVGSRDKAE
ncbi:hypothetical protein K3495_g4373 [Podosphaera aphanis]|nr:hypothetical protein K3495_g4373 [Podosphaera aphanis]